MIFTLESFHVERKDHAEFVNISEQRIWPDLEKNGARPIGLWSVVLGGPERILAMTRYDSLAQWQETRNWAEAFRRFLGTRRAGQRYERDRFAASHAAVSDEG